MKKKFLDIEKGYGVYFDKKKTLDYLHHSALKAVTSDNREFDQNIINALRINPVDYIDDNALDSATKIVESFENPSVGEGIMRKTFHTTYYGSGADFDKFNHLKTWKALF